ncbi:hypothetical protein HZH68_013716 [Vespula germanica]|uniref:Uncharacterized protein n=1 Tax=Vespula germanica TaxID=30212 RepID=A0A834JCS3_VESGE|nr:hypothetical protein HZH68_013716 [Vespula germanica]
MKRTEEGTEKMRRRLGTKTNIATSVTRCLTDGKERSKAFPIANENLHCVLNQPYRRTANSIGEKFISAEDVETEFPRSSASKRSVERGSTLED